MTGMFKLGAVVATPGILEAVNRTEIILAIMRHRRGDFGDLTEEDRKSNEYAVLHEERILSAYKSSQGVKFWIITEGDRSATTALLPEEY